MALKLFFKCINLQTTLFTLLSLLLFVCPTFRRDSSVNIFTCRCLCETIKSKNIIQNLPECLKMSSLPIYSSSSDIEILLDLDIDSTLTHEVIVLFFVSILCHLDSNEAFIMRGGGDILKI